MVQTKLIVLLAGTLLSCSCGPRFTWEKFPIDGHRTSVTPVDSENIDKALGTVENGIYTAPNGVMFENGATPLVAADMIAVQPRMASLKKVIAFAPEEMVSHRPESELSNFLVDHLMEEVGKATGRKIDVGILNFGGIRVNIPKGNVLLEDIVSMLPFKNYPIYLQLKGVDLQSLFDWMAETGMQVIGGAEVVLRDRKLDSLTIGGEPLDPEKLYGVATIDFLMDGGDGLRIARNAKDMVMMDRTLCEVILPCIEKLTEAGEPLCYHTDGRVVVIKEEN